MAVCDTAGDPAFWGDLARESREAWIVSGAAERTHLTSGVHPATGEIVTTREKNKCCEAREIQGDLPNGILGEKDLQEVADKLAGDFKDAFSKDCILAIHLNKSKTNLHYHLIHAERELLPEPKIRRAGDRAVYLDERGIRCRTKKEVLDADGQLRPGCRIVKKGDVISVRRFGEKEDLFSKRAWNTDIKRWMAEWVNVNLNPDQARTVFDPTGPYLPQMHVGKGRPAEQQGLIEDHNRLVRAHNAMIDDGTIDLEEATAIKGYVLMSPDRALALRTVYSLTSRPKKNERTKSGAEEMIRRQLREEYRLAAKARGEAASTKDELQRRVLIAEARRHSQQIDRLKIQLGIIAAETDKERAWQEELRRRQQLSEYWDHQKAASRCKNRIKWLQNEIFRLEWELAGCGIFDFERRAELGAQIEQTEAELKQAEEERALEKDLARMIRSSLKATKKASKGKSGPGQIMTRKGR